MDTTVAKSNSINPTFSLSAQQEQLLFRALNSNTSSNTVNTNPKPKESFSMAPASLHMESPVQAPGSGTMSGFESPFIDYDYEFDADGSFDYDFANDSQGQMIGKLPGTSSDGDADITVGHEKRSHEEGEDDEEGGGKRKETGKKPGRKPLTSEPTSVSRYPSTSAD
jgi:AP-1-like factor